MAPSRRPRRANQQSADDNVVTSNRNVENATKSGQQKRKLSDMLGPQWSKEELQHFYRAYCKHGKDCAKIAASLHDRSLEMVEALYTMNKAYLSLPKGHSSAAGLVAMMTDHYTILRDSDHEQETNEPMVAPQKPLKHARRSKELGEPPIPDLLQRESGHEQETNEPMVAPQKLLKYARRSKDLGEPPIPDFLQFQLAASTNGCLALLKKKRSGRQSAGRSTPSGSNMVDMTRNMPSSATTPDVPPGPSTHTSHQLTHMRHQSVGSSFVHPLPPAADTPPSIPQHEPSITYSIPNAGPGHDSSVYSGSDIESANRTEVTLRGDVLLPSGSCSRRIRKIFQKRLDIGGSRWKTVSQETKDFYFEQFKKYFYWDRAIDIFVKAAWEKKAAKRYSDLLNYVKSRESRPVFVSEAVWMEWQEFWNHPDMIRMSARNSKNRRGRDDRIGPSCHTGGSVSYAEHGRRLAAQLGRKPTPREFFLYTHTKNHDGKTFVDDRSRRVNKNFLSLLRQVSQSSDTVDENEMYLKAVGGEQKKRVYGLGSEASQYYKDDVAASFCLVNSKLEAYTTAIEQLEQRLASLQESFDQGITNRVQQQMASLEQSMELRAAELARGTKPLPGESRRHTSKKKKVIRKFSI